MTEIGSVIDGKYEVLKQIGKGGMSVVYLAMDKHLNKQWAVKEIRKQGTGKNDEIVVNSLLAEANLMKRLDHPALPRIVDIIDNGQTIYVIMDYIEGESLDKILAQQGPQPQELVIEWAKQLCDALSYLHSQKPPIIYRDMKPANIMLKPEGNLKVIDFGIAREYKENSLSDTDVLGTRGYAPPEQHGSRQTDARSDIYALGMTMHHLLTGADPRPADYVYAPIRQYNPNLSDGIETIINTCTALDPDDRYQNCSELMYDLEHYEIITKDYKKKQRNKLLTCIIGAGVCVLSVILGLVFMLMSSNAYKNEYNSLITPLDSASVESKLESYKAASDIRPYEVAPCMGVLEACMSDGSFLDDESEVFNDVYGKLTKNSQFDPSTKEFAELNFQAGIAYFVYYDEISDNGELVSKAFGERVSKAYPMFAKNNELGTQFDNKEISDVYYYICKFYKDYMLSDNKRVDLNKSAFDELLKDIDDGISSVANINTFDQLTFYGAATDVILDQMRTMSDVNVSIDDVLNVFDKLYDQASGINAQLTDQKEMKAKILDNYEKNRESIERCFENKEIREAKK